MRTEIRARQEPLSDSIELCVFQTNGHRFHILQLGESVALADGQRPEEPTIRLRNDEAQFLIDELWRCGLRPTEGTGSAGSLAATQKHLEDMRTVSFKLLENKLESERTFKIIPKEGR